MFHSVLVNYRLCRRCAFSNADVNMAEHALEEFRFLFKHISPVGKILVGYSDWIVASIATISAVSSNKRPAHVSGLTTRGG